MITGGGQNPLAGIYGMAADHVVAFQVVTADGGFITASTAENADLFWALRGGGGGTFAVVTSVIIRAHPKLNVVTSKWVLDASSNGVDTFWKGTKKSFDVFVDWADQGIYSFFVMGNTPAPFLNMMFLFAPNHTMES
jgi:FAD/FMN-containing dehydrogenase